VRLACVKRAASVDSEPGSNSRLNRFGFDRLFTAYLAWQADPKAYRADLLVASV
jgi:hypothetical protein